MLSAPAPTYTEDLYQFHWSDLGIEIILERFSESTDDIRCEMTVNSANILFEGRLYSGRLLLTGPNSRRDVRRELEHRTEGAEVVDWGGMLEQVCNLARMRYRQGSPIVDLASVGFTERPRFLLAPFIVHGGISMPYGDGKTSKSLFTLRNSVLLAMQGTRTLYLDWEDDEETHAERFQAICTGMEIEKPEGMIHYQHRSVRLQDSVREIRRAVAELGIGHVVVDSLGMAAGDPMDTGAIIEAMRATRSLTVAASVIHHLPKDAKDKTKPFGSVYASNEARLTWLIEKAQAEDDDEMSIVLTNYAINRFKLQPKQAYRLRFYNEDERLVSVTFDQVDVGSVSAFRKKLAQHVLIADVLKSNGRLRPGDIAEVLAVDDVDITVSNISVLLRRHSNLFVRLDDGYWGLALEGNTN